MFIKLIRSLLILSIFSSTVASLISNDYISFLRYFIITTFVQIVIYNIYKSISFNLEEKNELIRMAAISNQITEVRCPCPKAVGQTVSVPLNESSVYKCQDCNRSITAIADVKTFLATELIDINQGNNLLEKIYAEAVKTKSHGNTTI